MIRPLLLVTALAAVGLWISLSTASAGNPRLQEKEPRGASQKQQPPREVNRAAPGQKPTAARVAGYTPEREAAAVTFVSQHHPELARLLTQLKATNEREYFRAIRDLFRVSERMAQVQEEDPARYDNELRGWKLKSRVQLLGARVKMAPQDSVLREELHRALLEQIDHQRVRMEAERQLVADRLERLEAQISRFETQREAIAERQLNHFLGESQR